MPDFTRTIFSINFRQPKFELNIDEDRFKATK
jgi:hypothetical protein